MDIKIAVTISKRAVVLALLTLIIGAQGFAQSEADPNRPPCTTARCKKIEAFVKAHYCGESPAGNGPDDSCDPKRPKRLGARIDVLASYDCSYDEKKGEQTCVQHGVPSPKVRNILMSELHENGLPTNAPGQTVFAVWRSPASKWSMAEASYSRQSASELDLCQVLLRIDDSSHVIVLRKLPYKKTDADVPDVTEWTLLDVADIEGNGELEVVLEADAYEDHWLEVVSIHDGKPETLFSGLGYYL